MNEKKVQFNSLLVPTDFSENAWAAFQHALRLAEGSDAEIVVIHAIDPTLVEEVSQLGPGEHEDVYDSMRKRALSQLERYSAEGTQDIQVDTLVCEGDPFLEIIRKADDFAVDAIVMSKFGHRNQMASLLLFGSTAEKVVRGSRKPVLVLPAI